MGGWLEAIVIEVRDGEPANPIKRIPAIVDLVSATEAVAWLQ